jgi:metal-responsive CopG/Arc/MetJ family transcriptional regulator
VTGRGRPSTGVKVQVRIPADLLARVDSLADDYGVPRADMLRRMVALAADDADRRGWDVLGR